MWCLWVESGPFLTPHTPITTPTHLLLSLPPSLPLTLFRSSVPPSWSAPGLSKGTLLSLSSRDSAVLAWVVAEWLLEGPVAAQSVVGVRGTEGAVEVWLSFATTQKEKVKKGKKKN